MGWQPKSLGPRIVREYEGSSKTPYYATGIFGHSPKFATPQEGENWLRKYLERVPRSKAPQVRRCMCCGVEFESEGFHNRMCLSCRASARHDTSSYRYIRPSSRG